MPPTKATLAAWVGSWGLRSGLQSASFSFSINMGRSHTENSLSPHLAPPPACSCNFAGAFPGMGGCTGLCLVKRIVPHFVFPRRLWKSIPRASMGSLGKLACVGTGWLPWHRDCQSQRVKNQQPLEKTTGTK